MSQTEPFRRIAIVLLCLAAWAPTAAGPASPGPEPDQAAASDTWRLPVRIQQLHVAGRKVAGRQGDRAMVYNLKAPAAAKTQARLVVSGAARALAEVDGQIVLLRALPAKPRTLATDTLLLQDPVSQQGLILQLLQAHRDGQAAGQWNVSAGQDGAIVSLAWDASQQDQLRVIPFTGDALLAMDGVRRAEAQPVRSSPQRIAAAGQLPQPQAVAEARNSESEPLAVGGPDTDADGPWWKLFPNKTRLMDPLLADQREASMRFGYLVDHGSSENGDDTYFDVQLGADLVIFYKQFDADNEMTLSGRALVSSRLQVGENTPLLNVDYIGGAALGYRHKADTFELLLYHQSSHLGDETLDFGRRARIDYSREAVRLLWSRQILENLRVYAGPTFNFASASPDELDNTFILQAGAEYRWDIQGWPMYAAVDLQAKEENDWRVNVNTQVGLELGDKWRFFHRPRVFVEYFNGNSNMGQYWDEHESLFMLGFGFDL
ncbi:MAG: DUF1207 domain-containing protein [Phycisphaerae bacterium]